MPIISRIGRRRPRTRIAIGLLYVLLSLGALTTLYPFVLMVSTGFKGSTDQNDGKLIPKFWSDGAELTTKYIDDKYAGDAAMIASTRIGGKADHETVSKYEKFLLSLRPDWYAVGFRQASNQVTSRLNLRYQKWLMDRYHGSIEALNKAYIEENVAFQTLVPPAEMLERPRWKPTPGKKYQEWLEFKSELPAEFRVPIREQRLYQEFLRSKYENQFSRVPPELAGDAKGFESVEIPPVIFDNHVYKEYLASQSEWLPSRYKGQTVESLWGATELPIAAFETEHVREHSAELKREFSSRNYRYVLDYILINGRAVWVTTGFCLLAVAVQLFVNPLAAYVLSRFPMRASGRILMFLLATMAFPAEVAMIPSFLLLRDLGLLNTFAALVLPTAASGYMIFLLKGFFDSLPQELYESGSMDGAKETTLLWRIALPMARPVLGYLALMAFMAAYGSFMYAFLVAQDRRMWTLMVWIYQLQLSAPKSVTMAAVTLAALPTLVVFLLAQRVIMRGIVLPGER